MKQLILLILSLCLSACSHLESCNKHKIIYNDPALKLKVTDSVLLSFPDLATYTNNATGEYKIQLLNYENIKEQNWLLSLNIDQNSFKLTSADQQKQELFSFTYDPNWADFLRTFANSPQLFNIDKLVFDLILVFFPVEIINKQLSEINWHITSDEKLQRSIFNEKNQEIITIIYPNGYKENVVIVTNYEQGYSFKLQKDIAMKDQQLFERFFKKNFPIIGNL